MNPNQFLWTLISFLLTLMIFSYVFGDNPLFRVAIYLFVGVTSGYITILIFNQIIYPKFVMPFASGAINQFINAAIPLALSLLLLFKLSPNRSWLSSLPMAFVVGIGSAVVINGAIVGTIFPQVEATISGFGQTSPQSSVGIFSSFFILAGTISTMIYFQFSTLKFSTNSTNKILTVIRDIGMVFVGITLGSIFAGVILSALMALIERMDFILQFIFSFFVR